jgi:hypothetical protein
MKKDKSKILYLLYYYHIRLLFLHRYGYYFRRVRNFLELIIRHKYESISVNSIIIKKNLQMKNLYQNLKKLN